VKKNDYKTKDQQQLTMMLVLRHMSRNIIIHSVQLSTKIQTC